VFCPKCGAEHSDDSQFCSKCGRGLAVSVTSGGAAAAVAPARIPESRLATKNETSKTRSLKIAFLLDPESLRVLHTLLSETEGAIEYQVKFSDGSTIRYFDAKEVIDQPNAGRKRMVGIIATVEGEGRSISLTMRGDPEPSVEYSLAGGQKDVGHFADKLDDWIASCTQWYSPFHASNLGVLFGICLFALPFYLSSRVAEVFSPKGTDWRSYLSGLTLVGVGLGEVWVLKLFPRATFAIGYGARRNQLFGVIRVSVLLAIAVAVLREWLVRHL
jgi:hypothetical protein